MIRSFLLSLPILLVLDVLWLGFIARDFNLRQLELIGRIESGKFNLLLGPAVGAYLLMAASIALFSAPRAATAASGIEAFVWGALLGLVIYGVFDMTNLAILKGYPVVFALVDMTWGTLLYGLTTWLVAWKFGNR